MESNIVEILKSLADNNPQIRAKAVIELSKAGFSTPEPFINALNDPDADVRLAAATAIGNLGIKSAVQSLIACLQDVDEDVRVTTIWSLGKIRDNRAIPPIRAMLSDASPLPPTKCRGSIFCSGNMISQYSVLFNKAQPS